MFEVVHYGADGTMGEGVRHTVERARAIRPDVRIVLVPTFYHRARSTSSVALQALLRFAEEEGLRITEPVPERTGFERAQAFWGVPYRAKRRDDLSASIDLIKGVVMS